MSTSVCGGVASPLRAKATCVVDHVLFMVSRNARINHSIIEALTKRHDNFKHVLSAFLFPLLP